MSNRSDNFDFSVYTSHYANAPLIRSSNVTNGTISANNLVGNLSSGYVTYDTPVLVAPKTALQWLDEQIEKTRRKGRL